MEGLEERFDYIASEIIQARGKMFRLKRGY